MKIKITLLLLFFSGIALAQHKIDISYNESIDLGRVEAKTRFLIKGDSSKITKLTGDAINTYKFKKPGVYHLQVSNDHKAKDGQCDHNHLPDEIIVNVSRIKMDFLADALSFSAPILKNKETKGIVLSIPIQIETYDHQPVSLHPIPVNSAGIGTTVMALLDKNYDNLSEGTHVISYNLSGSVSENSYLMFDFIDANGKIQSVSLKQPVIN